MRVPISLAIIKFMHYRCINLFLREYVSGCYMFEFDILKNLLKKRSLAEKINNMKANIEYEPS